jgi:AcrR family transcriptional regulator
MFVKRLFQTYVYIFSFKSLFHRSSHVLLGFRVVPTPAAALSKPAPKLGKPGRRSGKADEDTPQRLATAAFETLRAHGFRGATARSIAEAAGCNQAAIYYHFGGIAPVLVAGLRASSDRRLAAYQAALEGITDLGPLLEALDQLHQDDVASGHFDVLTELLGGVTAEPELAAGLSQAIDPWLKFVAERIEAATKGLPLGAFVPASDLADALFGLVIGMQLQTKLDGNVARFPRLLNLGRLAAGLAAGFVPSSVINK